MYCIYLYRIVLLGLYHQLELYEIHRWMIHTSAPIKPCFPHWQNIIAYHSFPLCWVVCVKHTTCYTQTNIGPYKNPPPIIDLWQCCFLWKTHRVGWLCSGTCLYTIQPSRDQKLQDYGHKKQKQTALTLDCSSFIYPKISWWWLKKIICLTYHCCCCCCCLWSLIPITPLDHSPTDDMWRNRPLD